MVLCVSFAAVTGIPSFGLSINTDLPRCQTDDVGIFGSPLSNEYRLIAKHFGLSETEIRTLARKGINVIFGGEEEKQRLRQMMG